MLEAAAGVEGERKEVAEAAVAGAAVTSGEGEDGGARKESEAVICASTVRKCDQENNSIFFSFFSQFTSASCCWIHCICSMMLF